MGRKKWKNQQEEKQHRAAEAPILTRGRARAIPQWAAALPSEADREVPAAHPGDLSVPAVAAAAAH